jgi:arylsulfatase A-like enzyme
MRDESDYPQAKTVSMGLEFLERNHAADNWFLHVETFDPHEPYQVPERYRKLYDYDFSLFNNDWPPYRRVTAEDRALTGHYRMLNAALISMCDHHLGRILDAMDRLNLWEDTLLIVNTDHGFLLGEHDFWSKCAMPFYNEIAQTPLFIWDPRLRIAGERRRSLVQTIDLPASLLDYFGVPLPADMRGQPLRSTVAHDAPVREAGLFGLHGAHVNVTDGRYVYMRAPVTSDNTPLFNYTLMPAHMRNRFSLDELRSATMAAPFSFTKGLPMLRCEGRIKRCEAHAFGTLLFDNEQDPGQCRPLQDAAIEQRMCALLVREMEAHDAPPEQFERLGLKSGS